VPKSHKHLFLGGSPQNIYFLLSLPLLPWSSWPAFWETQILFFFRIFCKNLSKISFSHFSEESHTHTSCTAFPLEPPNSIQLDFLLALLSLPWSSWPSFRKTPKRLYFSHFSGKLLANYGFRIVPPTQIQKTTLAERSHLKTNKNDAT
jgi:hypothetical protein